MSGADHHSTSALARFLHSEVAGGVVLLACTAAALVVANSPLASAYHDIWATKIGVDVGGLHLRLTLEHWINDGSMAIFFFLIGLEVKRELVLGELREPQRAALPVVAALGGMLVPAGIYLLVIGNGPAARGWGIPMATDIAFVVGCMALLGTRVPRGLRILLLTLAIADDIGAILVIAIGYSTGIDGGALALAALGLGGIVVLQRLGVRAIGMYTLVGVLVWLAVLHSGVHATIAGVLLGLLTPARPLPPATSTTTDASPAESPLAYLERLLHPWVRFAIMPIFALANAGVACDLRDLADPVALAVGAGLLLGKPLGVVAASWLAVRAGLSRLPDGVGWAAMAGAGLLAGIGFTMALFITGLALPAELRDTAKVGILLASVLAAAAGMTLLTLVLPSRVSLRISDLPQRD